MTVSFQFKKGKTKQQQKRPTLCMFSISLWESSWTLQYGGLLASLWSTHPTGELLYNPCSSRPVDCTLWFACKDTRAFVYRKDCRKLWRKQHWRLHSFFFFIFFSFLCVRCFVFWGEHQQTCFPVTNKSSLESFKPISCFGDYEVW